MKMPEEMPQLPQRGAKVKSYRVIQKVRGAILYARPTSAKRVSYCIALHRNKERVRITLFAANENDVQAKRRAIEMFKQTFAEFEKGLLSKQTVSVGRECFLAFFDDLIKTKKPTTANSWKTALLHLRSCYGEQLLFKQIDRQKCFEFRNHLEKRVIKGELKASTANTILAKFKCALNLCFQQGFVAVNHANLLKAFPSEPANVAFLTIEELTRLLNTQPNKIRGYDEFLLKSYVMFQALTGVRPVDSREFCWGAIQRNELGYYIDFAPSKTRNKGVSIHRIYLHPELVRSLEQLKARQANTDADDKIFPRLPRPKALIDFLRKWLRKAGIDKNLTIYGLRHSCATILLETGKDIYTVSKVLAHRSIQHTTRYIHLAESSRARAVLELPVKLNHGDGAKNFASLTSLTSL